MKQLFIIFLGSFFMLASCQQPPVSKVKSKTLHISINSDPTTLDSRKSGDLVSSTLLFMLFSGLTETKSNGQIGPAIAQSWEISDDQRTYTFHLRDALWSDGEPITAYDFENSWKKVLDPSFPALCPQLFYPIKGAEAVSKGNLPVEKVGISATDAKTLIVELEAPTPYFLSLTSFCVYFPVPTHIDKKFPDWAYTANEHFVSNGPFLLEKWEPTSEIQVKKNPKFFDKERVKLDQISLHIVDNENTALQMFELNQLDLLGTPVSPIPVDSLSDLHHKKKLILSPIGGTSFCAFNTTQFPFNNLHMRKAFSSAINRKDIVENITQLNEVVGTRCLPPVLMHNENKFLLEDNDAAEAKKHFQKALEELNIKKEDLKITFSYANNLNNKKLAQALQEQWNRTLGVFVELEGWDEKTMLQKLHKHQFQSALAMWIVQYNDPMNILERFKYRNHSKNYPLWENPDFINLLDLVNKTTDARQRTKLIEDAEVLLLDETPLTPLYHFNYATIAKNHVRNFIVGPIGDIHFDEVFLEENK